MELSPEEKARIIAEERLRFETRLQLQEEQRRKDLGAGCGGFCGWTQRGGFCKGLALGLVLYGLFSFAHAHRGCRFGRFCHRGQFSGGPAMPGAAPNSPGPAAPAAVPGPGPKD